jgi:CheY-like chemotaxis protein
VAAGAGARVSDRRPRVLIVEDDDAIALVIHDLLQIEGFEVRRARDGQAGLSLLQTFEPHVILLDLMMPVLDGRGFRAGQRRLPPHLSDIPIVVLSGAREAATAAHDLGAASLVVKPFELDALTEAIHSALITSG